MHSLFQWIIEYRIPILVHLMVERDRSWKGEALVPSIGVWIGSTGLGNEEGIILNIHGKRHSCWVLFVLLDNKSSSRLSSSICYINCETLNSLLKIHSQSQNYGIKAWLLLLLSACKTLLPLMYHYASTQDLTPFWPRKSCNASSELWEYFWKICPISWIPFSFPRLYFGVSDDLTKILTSLSL